MWAESHGKLGEGGGSRSCGGGQDFVVHFTLLGEGRSEKSLFSGKEDVPSWQLSHITLAQNVEFLFNIFGGCS